MTKRSLKERIAKLEHALKESEEEAKGLRKQLAEYAELGDRCARLVRHNEKFKELFDKVRRKNQKLKSRNEQVVDQLAMLAESNVMLRSELFANIHAAQHRSAKLGHMTSEVEQVMPGGGKPALVYEDEQERGRKKRFGTRG